MFTSRAHLSYPTHNSLVYTSNDTGRIYCVKYTDKSILWEHWERDQWDQCKEYMIEEPPAGSWGFVADSE